MDQAQQIREFLATRRAKVTPGQVGLPAGSRRRVSGLRREEVAALAGVSVEYYVQIERGQVPGVSDEVLAAVAQALRLDAEETDHLVTLVRGLNTRPDPIPARRRSPREPRVPAVVAALMNSMVNTPAVVQNGRLDLLEANLLGRVLYGDVLADSGVEHANLARFLFLSPHAEQLFPAWENAADDAVALLHVEAARAPHDAALIGLVGELATRSDRFRTRWAAHDVRAHRRGVKRFHHREVGELTLRYEALEITSVPGLTLIGYSADPGSPTEEALRLLSSWAATNSDSPASETYTT
ncbi:helix-turn-helix transcriptional regulator [Actinomycetospora sp. OC33-EN08]|uniref:Helix-turn-helix transcriptional regulator n=1 Tax=Actinomycetospora aurantiaca TaxID=3129233 RepID=A0ABU8MVN5_9PSEU